MRLHQLFGEYRTGKTQLCHTLCVTSQLQREEYVRLPQPQMVTSAYLCTAVVPVARFL